MASLSEWKYSLLVTELSQAFTYAVVEVCTLRGNQIIVHLCTIGITLGRIGVKPGVGQTYAAGDAVLVHVGEASVGQLNDSLEFYRIVNRGGFKLVFVIGQGCTVNDVNPVVAFNVTSGVLCVQEIISHTGKVGRMGRGCIV